MSNETKAKATDSEHDAAIGMSLRDWFAGQALAGVLASENAQHHWPMNDEDQARESMKGVARFSFDAADAMIAARGGAQ